jgi:hypothetical protein
LLIAAGDNLLRLRSEAAFAALCSASPIPASSGTRQRHRLNRSGNREANCALFRIALSWLRWDPATKAYAERRTADGKSKREILRCLKRFIAREIYRMLQAGSLRTEVTRALNREQDAQHSIRMVERPGRKLSQPDGRAWPRTPSSRGKAKTA